MSVTEARKYCLKAAQQGFIPAQYQMGVYCQGGHIRIAGKNMPKEAFKWYKMAAERGHIKAQHTLGWHYEYGAGVTKNKQEAAKWYRLAATNPYAKSVYFFEGVSPLERKTLSEIKHEKEKDITHNRPNQRI